LRKAVAQGSADAKKALKRTRQLEPWHNVVVVFLILAAPKMRPADYPVATLAPR
jgi:hypothetical protein